MQESESKAKGDRLLQLVEAILDAVRSQATVATTLRAPAGERSPRYRPFKKPRPIADLIRRTRVERKLSLTELARKIGTTSQTIGKFERGVTRYSKIEPQLLAALDIADDGKVERDLVEANETEPGSEAAHRPAVTAGSNDSDPAAIFVAPPASSEAGTSGRRFTQALKKFDAARDAANRQLGEAGEAFVLRLERDRLIVNGRGDLAERVVWTAQTVGDGLGYDIESFADDGSPVFIEVKTTKGPIGTAFFLTENERAVAAEKGSAFKLYRLFGFGTRPQIYYLSGPLDDALLLEPVCYRARPAQREVR